VQVGLGSWLELAPRPPPRDWNDPTERISLHHDPSTGHATFDAHIVPGTYDVFTGFPARWFATIDVVEDEEFTLDVGDRFRLAPLEPQLPPVVVSGRIDVNGSAFPSGVEAPRVVWRCVREGEELSELTQDTLSVREGEALRFTIEVEPGVYEVSMLDAAGGDALGEPVRGVQVLHPEVRVSGDWAQERRSFDVKWVDVMVELDAEGSVFEDAGAAMVWPYRGGYGVYPGNRASSAPRRDAVRSWEGARGIVTQSFALPPGYHTLWVGLAYNAFAFSRHIVLDEPGQVVRFAVPSMPARVSARVSHGESLTPPEDPGVLRAISQGVTSEFVEDAQRITRFWVPEVFDVSEDVPSTRQLVPGAWRWVYEGYYLEFELGEVCPTSQGG